MLCTCTFHAVAHTQLHVPHSPHCSSSTVHVFGSHFQRGMMIIWTRKAGLTCSISKSYSAGAEDYDPNTRPTLVFTTPVNIWPPRPPIDQLEETTSWAHRFLASRSLSKNEKLDEIEWEYMQVRTHR
jgi:hypothetical protein